MPSNPGGCCRAITSEMALPQSCKKVIRFISVLGIGSSFHCEHHAKPCLAARHAFVGFIHALEWKSLVHRMHVRPGTETKRVLRIDRQAGVPAFHRTVTRKQKDG